MKRSFLLGVLLIALLIVPFSNAVAENNVPRTINYTGNLYDYAGQPINKAVDLNVKIFNSQTGGSALWTEDHRNVQVEFGYFSVNLGTESPLNLDFQSQYWVELSVNGNSYARVPFTSTPYAFQSVKSFRADTASVAKEVVDGAITLASLAAETRVVTGDVTGTYPELYIKDGVVVSKIGKGQITNYHISESVSLPPAGPAGGALTGQYPDPKIAENAIEAFNIMDGAITYPKLQNATGPMGTILVWNGYAWVESAVNAWEVDGVIGNEVDWATNGLEILTDEDGHLGVGIMYGGVTNDMLAGDITSDKLAGDIPLDKFAPGYLSGQVMWWNNLQKEWQLTPNAPKENYVIKWVFDHEAGQAKLEWAEDNMSIPFFYEGASIDPNSTEPNLYSKTMFELVLDGTRGDVASGNDVHGIAVTINDTKAGSAMVLDGSGMNDGNMMPVAQILGEYIGSGSYDKGALYVNASVRTTADAPSAGAVINHSVTNSNLGITTYGALVQNMVEYNHYGEVYGLNVMSMTSDGSRTDNKVIGVMGTAMGDGSEIAAGVIGTAMNSTYNVGTFGGVNVDGNTWNVVKSNAPRTNIGVVAYGGFDDQGGYLYSNSLAFYAYGNSQFDGEITVRDNAYLNSDLYVQGNTYMQGNLTDEGYADFNGTLNIDGMFSLDGVQGAAKQIMIGNGVGNTPVWISVANLMENLTDGAGIVTFLYDGSAPAKVIVDYDLTLKMDVAGDAGKIGLDLGHQNSWTTLQTFSSVAINGGNINNTIIGNVTPAAATFSTATVNGLLTAATVDLNGGNIDGTIIGAMVPAAGTFTTGTFTTVNTVNETVTGLLTAATVDINGGAIDGTIIGAMVPAAGTFTTGTFTTVNTVNETVTGLLTAAMVDINGGAIDGTTIGATVAAPGTFTNATVTGLLTAATVDINGGNIDNTIIGAAVPTSATFTTANITTANVTDLALTGTLKLDGAQGAVKEILIGNGAGNTPVWITVANLMENLTDGAGIAPFVYDGSAVAKVVADIDGTSLVFTDATDAAKIKINMANANLWTALQTFATVDINGGNIDATIIGASTPAAATFSTATVTGLLTAAMVDINGGNIDGTVIGNDTPAEAYFTDLYSPMGTIDDLTVNTLMVNTSLTLADAAPLFASNGTMTPSEGNIGDLLVSRGAGFSPEWTTSIPLLDVTEFSTDHLVVNDNTQASPMTPYFEVPFDGERVAHFGGPALGQEVDVTIYGVLTVNNLEVVETVPYLEIYDLNVTHNITLDGKIIGGDADFENVKAINIDADYIETDRLHVNLDTYLTHVEVNNGETILNGNLVLEAGVNLLAKGDIDAQKEIYNSTSTSGVQNPVLVSDLEGLNVPNGPVHAKRLTLGVAAISAIGDLPDADAGIINYSDTQGIGQADLPTNALEGEVLYIANTSTGTVSVLGTPVATQSMIVLVYLSGTWIVMP